MDKDTKQIQGS